MQRTSLLFIIWLSQVASGFSAEKLYQESVKDSVSLYVSEASTAAYNNFPKAMELLEKAASFAEESEEIPEVDYAYGSAYYVKGDYTESLKFFLKASEGFRNQGDDIGIAKGLLGQGLIQQVSRRHPEAINLFKKAIDSYMKASGIGGASAAYHNIAISEIELGNFDTAKNNLEKAIDLAIVGGRIDVEHMSYNKLGEIFLKENDPRKATTYYFKVLHDETEPSNWEKSFAHSGLAQTYLYQEDLKLAEEHALRAVGFAEITHSLWDLERNTEILSNIYSEKGDMTEAYKYLQLNQQYKDSLYNIGKAREINLLQLENQEAENRRLLSEKELAEKKLSINKIISFLLVLVTLFLILLLVLFRRNTIQKEKFNKELEERNRTISEKNKLILKRNNELAEIDKAKNRLFSILSHDLKSPIGSIQQLLEMMKSGNFTAEEQTGLLDEMLKQITGTSFMLHNLLHWAASQLDGNKVSQEKLILASEVEQVLGAHYWPAKHKHIAVIHEPKENLPAIRADKDQLSVILHNLISNAIKFTPEGGTIEISYINQEGKLQLIVRDEGEGMSEKMIAEIKNHDTRMLSGLGTDMETGTGLGLLLVKDFLKANNAELDIVSVQGKGSEFKLSFLKASY